MEATLQFYNILLSFNIENYVPELGWVSLQRDEINQMFTQPNAHRNIPQAIMSGSLYINTLNIDELWEKLKDKCNICYPIEDFEYGMREFAIYDNNGYLLQFGQEITKNYI
jgi:uncharacterized glyoxalase superfamily protein PhnB